MKTTRRKFTASFKAKVAIEALKEQKTLGELSQEFKPRPNLISTWKRDFFANALTGGSAFLQYNGNISSVRWKTKQVSSLDPCKQEKEMQ